MSLCRNLGTRSLRCLTLYWHWQPWPVHGVFSSRKCSPGFDEIVEIKENHPAFDQTKLSEELLSKDSVLTTVFSGFPAIPPL